MSWLDPKTIAPASRTLVFISAGALVQDKFHGLSLGDWAYPDAALLIVAALAALVTWNPFANRAFWWRKPQLEVVGVGDFYRSAAGSRLGEDLQVIYARIRNVRDGGGERVTFLNAEAWLVAMDQEGRAVGHGNKGIWLNVRAGTPDPNPLERVTLRPNGEQFALEIASKFKWGQDAWVAGAHREQLQPGTYRIRASISDSVHKAAVFEWLLLNPGGGEDLWLEGLGPKPSGPTRAALVASASTYVPTTETISLYTQAASGTALPPPGGFPSDTSDSILELLDHKMTMAIVSAYRDIVQKGHAFEEAIVRAEQTSEGDDEALRIDVSQWANRCLAWANDPKLGLTAGQRGAFRAGPPPKSASLTQLAEVVAANLAALRAVSELLGE